ncbi:MAG: sensor histidine kinase, partial [Desulfuromonadaceae bacterium]
GADEDRALDEQMEQLRNYNKILFDKLEAKMSTLQRTIEEQQKTEKILKLMQQQIIQQEKMASIGQLAAGVAHEINNPVSFIASNLTSLGKYADRFDQYIAALQQSLYSCASHHDLAQIDALRQKLKIDYIISDVRELVNESIDGVNRVRRIVQDLKSFSRVDQAEHCRINLNDLLETTINIACNELKYIAVLERNFGEIPAIYCYPQQLNQVFLNLLVNATQAMEKQGSITINTWSDNDNVFVSVADTGKGMSEQVQKCIFEPFYTTKEIGKGTGLGLSISADIICKHLGKITVSSEVGVGSTFTVRLPLNQPNVIK